MPTKFMENHGEEEHNFSWTQEMKSNSLFQIDYTDIHTYRDIYSTILSGGIFYEWMNEWMKVVVVPENFHKSHECHVIHETVHSRYIYVITRGLCMLPETDAVPCKSLRIVEMLGFLFLYLYNILLLCT